MLSGLTGTRIFRPSMSLAVSIGLPLVVIWRKPLSHIFSKACRRDLGDRGADMRADLAVHRGPDLVIIGERETHRVDARPRARASR